MMKRILAGWLLATGVVHGQDVTERVDGLNRKLLPILAGLAREYDAKKDPEAAHFFAECTLGLGAADDGLQALRRKWEDEVYYGRARGGKVLEDVAPIEGKLAGLGREYRAIVDELMKKGAASGLTDAEKVPLHAAVVRSELAQWAHEYVQATQRFNELRRCMKLRAILWEYESSAKFILAGWYMCDRGDTMGEDSDRTALTYTPAADFAKGASARMTELELPFARIADEIRPYALVRQGLLEANARRLWLGHWVKTPSRSEIGLYGIPALQYRPDIPTPSKRYAKETIAELRDLWKDVEETIQVADKRLTVSHYPFEDERDAPFAFGYYGENHWREPYSKLLHTYGLPIMLKFDMESETPNLTEVEYEVRKDKAWPIPCRIFLTGDKNVGLYRVRPVVLLVPKKHLEKGTKYHVAIKGKISGTPFEKKWSFATRSK